jgi:hypothetical protein
MRRRLALDRDSSHGQEVDMRDHHDDGGSVPEPQGRHAGLPYDFRRPTAARIRARAWNPDDPRILTPKTFGWGLGVNFYWLLHPVRLVRAHRRSR